MLPAVLGCSAKARDGELRDARDLLRNARGHADCGRCNRCPDALAMQHSGAAHGPISSRVSHSFAPLSKQKNNSVGIVDQTAVPGARQRRSRSRQTACSVRLKPAPS